MAQINIPIGTELRQAMTGRRIQLGLTQPELGRDPRWGKPISTETISKIQSGRSKFAWLAILTTLVLRLGFTPDDLAVLDSGYPQVAARMRWMMAKEPIEQDSVNSLDLPRTRVYHGSHTPPSSSPDRGLSVVAWPK